MWVYTAGYSIYLFVVGWTAWATMTFWEWCTYLTYESFYALVWPVLVVLSLLGYR
jgi:hypothetical protein